MSPAAFVRQVGSVDASVSSAEGGSRDSCTEPGDCKVRRPRSNTQIESNRLDRQKGVSVHGTQLHNRSKSD